MDALTGLVLTNAAAAGLIALVAWVASRATKRQTVVHGLWLLALAKLVTPPIAPMPLVPSWTALPSLSVPAVPTVVPMPRPLPGAEQAAPSPLASAPAVLEASSAASAPSSTRPAPSRLAAEPPPARPALLSFGWRQVAGTLLLVGAMSVGLLTAWRFTRFRRLLASATSAPEELVDRTSALAARMGLRRAPPVLLLPARIPPMLWPRRAGPVLLLPEGLVTELGSAELDTLVAHELAHVCRRDHWVRLVELAATALFWWYPVTWWARRALRRAEERCCDERVLRLFPRSAEAYASGLLKSLSFVAGTSVPSVASGAGPVEDLETRLKEILMTRPVPQLPTPLRLALAAGACLGLAVFPTHADPAAAPQDAPVVPAVAPAPASAPAPAPAPPAVVAPVPAPRPVAAPRAVVAPAAPGQAPVGPTPAPAPPSPGRRGAERREFEEQQGKLEQQRLKLHQQQLELEQARVELEAKAQQVELQAEAERLRAAGRSEDAARIERQLELTRRRMDLQRRQLALEAERMAVEAKLEAQTRAHRARLEATEEGERGSAAEEDARRALRTAEKARQQAEVEVRRQRQAIEKEMQQAETEMRALRAEDHLQQLRLATDELARSLADQLAAMREALAHAPGERAEIAREMRRLEAALDALRSEP